jgi:hypothetical protein
MTDTSDTPIFIDELTVEEVIEDTVEAEVEATPVCTRTEINNKIIRELKKYRKINKWMTGARDFADDDIEYDEEGKEIEKEPSREENKWYLLNDVPNPVGTLETILMQQVINDKVENDSSWTWKENSVSIILKLVKKHLIRNNITFLAAWEGYKVHEIVEFLKYKDMTFGTWTTLSDPSQFGEEAYLAKMKEVSSGQEVKEEVGQSP